MSHQLPDTVDVIGIHQTGGFEVIEKLTLPFPKPGQQDFIIKVEYGGVNFIDTYYRKGLYPVSGFPAAIGEEAAGIVAALPTDPALLSDPKFQRRGYTIGGRVAVNFQGVHATYIAVPWHKTYPVPPSIPSRVAAASLTQALTAVTFFEEAYNVQKGDIILIHTIAGGLGLLMCQLGKYRGAIVIGTTSTKEKAELAKSHGADHVINYREEDTVQRVLEITNGEGVNAIFDGVGKDTFDSDFKMIRRKGTLITLGNASGAVPPFEPLKLYEKNVRLLRPRMGNYLVTEEEIHHYGTLVFDLIEKGVLKTNIYKEYPFTAEGVQQAQIDLTSGKTTGKLLINISED